MNSYPRWTWLKTCLQVWRDGGEKKKKGVRARNRLTATKTHLSGRSFIKEIIRK